MKKKKLTNPIFALALLFGALCWSGCSSDCPTNCDSIRVDKVGIDTNYYPYVSDFEANGRIYTYKIIVDGQKFIRSYKMSQFEHKIEHEYDRFWYNGEDCSIECKVKTQGYYEMKCNEIGGSEFESAIYRVKDDVFYYQFYGGEFFYRDGMSGYRLYFNEHEVDTFKIDINQKIQWLETYILNGNMYVNVSCLTGFGENKDTLWHYAYNKQNGILLSIDNSKELENEIKLLKIE